MIHALHPLTSACARQADAVGARVLLAYRLRQKEKMQYLEKRTEQLGTQVWRGVRAALGPPPHA